ncbi:hypothetical protein Vadar_011548 [Vaccinium darrowii]|uniref:Uncharacterized protein n=1 Tax=Vaccinium darrowii TaxID=229202 RepID=A0ACB7Z5M7_9ERIC|nr:hypothetical protein Vadar_011548 [Vaccinium darrowii]
MAGEMVKNSTQFRRPDGIGKFPGRQESMAVLIFGFLDEGEESSESLCNSGESSDYGGITDIDVHDDELVDERNVNNVEKDKAFWEAKEQNLKDTIYRSSSIETKIRHATKEALREIRLAGNWCGCKRPVAADGCRSCLQRGISDRLRLAGYNCGICESKWRSSPDIPSGEHTYLEVIDNSNPKKGEVKVVIELNFRAEFEMARANEDYNRLISKLPELFVGKTERLKVLIKILCSAAKKCMEDRKMHMGPWRKHKYVQAKWFGTSERMTLPATRPDGFSRQLPKPRASMLTFDLGQNLPVLRCTAVN